MNAPATVREWLAEAAAGAMDDELVERHADAHLYIGHRLLRLLDAPVETLAPVDVFSAEWIAEKDGR